MNEGFFKEYIDFINDHKVEGNVDFYCEKHHIYPRKLYPELTKDKTNIVKLRARDHLKAHILLYKAFDKCSEMAFALNMMANRGKLDERFDIDIIEKDFEHYGMLYEEFRKEVAKCISKNNKGRKVTDEQKQLLHKLHKGYVVVKDKNNNTFRVSVDDPRYKSGELVYYQTGNKHSEETKKKMSENGIKGLHPYYNNEGKVVYAKECPEGFTYGLPEEQRKKLSDKYSNSIHVYNPITNESLRIDKDQPIPKGFVHMRAKKGKFQGFDAINTRIRVYNIRTKELNMKSKEEINFDEEIVSISASDGKDILNNDLFIIDNVIYMSAQDIKPILNDKYDVIIPKHITDSNKAFAHYIQNPIDIDLIKRMKHTKNGKNKLILDNENELLSKLFKINVVKLKDLEYNDLYKVYASEEKRAKYGKRI